MNFIHKHKFTTCAIVVIIIITIAMIALLRFLLPNYKGDLYGNRLNGISSYKISDDAWHKLKEGTENIEGVNSVDYLLEGRLINITLSVNDEMEQGIAKENASSVLQYFSEEERKYYDIQVFVTSDNEESEKYPIIGYKHKTSESLIWSNN